MTKRTKLAATLLCAAVSVLTALAVHALSAHYRSPREAVGREAVGIMTAADTEAFQQDAMQFDLVCRVRPGQLLYELLHGDSIIVIDSVFGRRDGTIRVATGKERFLRTFSAVMSTRSVARSSGEGFLVQEYLERYAIPEKYRRFIGEIRLPDPQVE